MDACTSRGLAVAKGMAQLSQDRLVCARACWHPLVDLALTRIFALIDNAMSSSLWRRLRFIVQYEAKASRVAAGPSTSVRELPLKGTASRGYNDRRRSRRSASAGDRLAAQTMIAELKAIQK